MPGLKDPNSFTEDSEIEGVLKEHLARIKVLGVGGAGNNTVNRLKKAGVVNTELIAVNTDASDLLENDADHKILIGEELTNGFGAGADPNIGEEAARETQDAIKKSVKDADVVFITCGLGGGTGTGAAPVVAEIVKDYNILSVGIVTLPFTAEGRLRLKNANRGLSKLREHVDTLIVLPNDKLMEIVPDAPITTAFRVCDEVLINAVKGMAELISKPGLVNVDFADVKAVMKSGGVGVIGIGQSDSDDRQEMSVKKAINNPLLSVDITNARSALVNVMGGEDLTLHQAHDVMEMISSRLHPEAQVIFGAHIDETLKDAMRVMIIVTGIAEGTFAPEKPDKPEELVKEELSLEDEYGLEVVVPSKV